MPETTSQPRYSARYLDALVWAGELFATQIRKGGEGEPYLAHLLSVSALVWEDGGDEDEAIAALLHDAAEDQGGQDTLDEIKQRYGHRVADLVAGCSDTFTEPKPPWRARKEAHLQHLELADASLARITAADKLHNVRSILASAQDSGVDVFAPFKGGRDGTIWYYERMAAVLGAKLPTSVSVRLLQDAVLILAALA
jgi:(p)ppGpp synthase/HD superfamily hydrolase